MGVPAAAGHLRARALEQAAGPLLTDRGARGRYLFYGVLRAFVGAPRFVDAGGAAHILNRRSGRRGGRRRREGISLLRGRDGASRCIDEDEFLAGGELERGLRDELRLN